MNDLIDRDQLKAMIAETRAELQRVRYGLDDIPPVTSEIVCNNTIAISKTPANIITYSRSFRDLVQELHNCPNCGGSIDGEGMCRYCGSRVYRFGGI